MKLFDSKIVPGPEELAANLTSKSKDSEIILDRHR
jgi:hypothetical protein